MRFGAVTLKTEIPLIAYLIIFRALFKRNPAQANAMVPYALLLGSDDCLAFFISAADCQARRLEGIPNRLLSGSFGDDNPVEIAALPLNEGKDFIAPQDAAAVAKGAIQVGMEFKVQMGSPLHHRIRQAFMGSRRDGVLFPHWN